MESESFYRVSALVYATEAQAEVLEQQVQRLLCPDPDHQPPCPIPWETFVEPVTEGQDTESLQQQIDAEGGSPA